MPSEKDARRVEHGETYQHSSFGEVEVMEIIDPIAAIGPDGPERNYFVKFTTDLGGGAIMDTQIHRRRYEDFVEGLE